MTNKEAAIAFNAHALSAIRELTLALIALQKQCSDDKIIDVKSSIGDIVARIDNLLVDNVYKQYPELDDVRNK